MRPEELRDKQKAEAIPPDQLHQLVEREFAVIGKRMRKVNSVGKVTGTAVYTDDIALPVWRAMATRAGSETLSIP